MCDDGLSPKEILTTRLTGERGFYADQLDQLHKDISKAKKRIAVLDVALGMLAGELTTDECKRAFKLLPPDLLDALKRARR